MNNTLWVITIAVGATSQCIAAAQVAAPPTQPQQLISVGRNLHVSRESPRNMHAQTLAVANPRNPDELLSCSHTLRPGKDDVSLVYLSLDAGATWIAITPNLDQMSGTDPTVAFGTDDALYFAYIAHPPGKLESVVLRSPDRGKTWSSPFYMDMIDRHFLTVDHSNSPYRGRVYLAGDAPMPDKGRGFGLRYSKGGDLAFSKVAGVKAPDGWAFGAFSPGVILSDGTLVFVAKQRPRKVGEIGFGSWPTERDGKIVALRSKDGGDSLAVAGVLTEHFADTAVLLASNDFLGLAADTSAGPFRERVYAAFSSYDPDTGRRDILASYSTDQGATWSKPVAVNDDDLPADLHNSPKHFMPTLAVNKFGVVGVTWHDRRGSPNGVDWTVRFSASLDGGETYLPSTVVAEVPFNTDTVTWFPYPNVTGGGTSRKYGPFTRADLRDARLAFSTVGLVSANFNTQHTAGLATDGAGVFHSFWIDNRAQMPQLWTAPITVGARVARNGGGELEDLDDVSTTVALLYENARYDRESRILALDARLENVSNAKIHGPFFLRVIATQPRMHLAPYSLSSVGDYLVVNADNGYDGDGAAWRFRSPRADEVLNAGERSAVRELRFRLTTEPSFQRAHQRGTYNGGFLRLVGFDAKVLARQ